MTSSSLRSTCGIGAGLAPFITGLHQRVALPGSVVPCAESLVEGHEAVAIIHLKELVVEIVGIGMAIDRCLLAHHDLVETDMANNSAAHRKVNQLGIDLCDLAA